MAKVRHKLVVGNWKLNGSKVLADGIKSQLNEQAFDTVQVAVCPPLTLLAEMRSKNYALGAQDVSTHSSGAYTGEVSATMLAEAGCSFVIVGHSERRTYHAEDDELVATKAQQAILAGLTPIVCFGESEEVRESGDYTDFCIAQVEAVKAVLGDEQFARCVLAYEPIWAIGTGKTASPEQAQEMHSSVRAHIATSNHELAEAVKILYGGSVKGENAQELFAQPDVDGGLIGGASLKAEDFLKICLAAE